MSEVTRYVVGFLLDDDNHVLLIRKNRPAWQRGLLNGIGGHVEPGETSGVAIRREFYEETGLELDGWRRFVTMTFPGAVIDFYRLRVLRGVLRRARTTTDEAVTVLNLPLAGQDLIPNLTWLVPLAAYTADRYEPIEVRASMADVRREATP